MDVTFGGVATFGGSLLSELYGIHMRRRAGPVTEISVTELEIFPI